MAKEIGCCCPILDVSGKHSYGSIIFTDRLIAILIPPRLAATPWGVMAKEIGCFKLVTAGNDLRSVVR